ncbi:MAG: hypothetical protein RIM23_08060 [Coleofasciculus sp. G3-WIS-01]|uniref:hypothetical protein n=1 Tax=Coleofasciculus sp. G3-WIS-01 TaxID=3069528 RepID=UPI0032F7C5BD
MTNSTISDNKVEGGSAIINNSGNSYGGGISGEVVLINSTVSGNIAEGGPKDCQYTDLGNGYGGGIWGRGTVTNSTSAEESSSSEV